MFPPRHLLPFTVVVAMAHTASAATIIDSSTNYQVEASSVDAKSSSQDVQVGTFNDSSGLWTFELPVFDINTATDADITLAYQREVNIEPPQSVTLFVNNSLRATDSATTADYIAATTDPAPAGWTLIQEDFVIGNSSTNRNVSLSSTGKSNLLNFLQTNYTAGEFLVIGAAFDLNGNPAGTFDRFEFQPGAFSGGVNQLALIPEPAVASLVVMGMIPLLSRRRTARV